MTSEQIRKSFLDFFAARGHKIVAGSPLISPDPTSLFTSAGVQQFVPAFRGDVTPPARRLATCQICLRVDDVDEVGDATHDTFFEMLGNFSIGDYFKQESIAWGWEYCLAVGMQPERIWISVHPDDDEAYQIWRNIGIPAERIVKLEDNWWPTFKNWVGSCGPNTEMYYDMGEQYGCGKPDCSPACSCGRFMEYWNHVLPQFMQHADGSRTLLDPPGIDTGMGMERIALILQDKTNIFETDLFHPIVEAIHTRARELNPVYRRDQDGDALKAVRIVADHSRAVAFALADGVLPSNEGRGYVVRKLLRRASYFGWKLAGALSTADTHEQGFEQFVMPVIQAVITTMESPYPHLKTNRDFILNNVTAEEERFESAIINGFHNLTTTLAEITDVLPGEAAFRFYDTYGIPLDLTREIAAERNIRIDEEGFNAAMAEQRARSRAAAGEKFVIQRTGVYQNFIGATEFVGYKKVKEKAKIIGLVRDGEALVSVSEGEVEIILDKTPFYAEQGGQVGDTGRITVKTAKSIVQDTVFAIEGVIAHKARIEKGTLKVGDTVTATIDVERRRAIARSHTGTHVLHYVLRETLGPHAKQGGSLVEADWFRFDFSHFERLTDEQLQHITNEVNRLILENHPIKATITDLETARALGAMALFGEKYGDQVRMMQTGDFSKELCGGTHLHSTAEIGLLLITGEGSVGAGLRRIEAVCGTKALALIQQKFQALSDASALMQSPEELLIPKIESLQNELRQTQRQIASLQHKQAGDLAQDLMAQVEKVGEINVLATKIPPMAPDAFRTLADTLIGKIGSGVIVLAAEGDASWPMVAKVSDDLVSKGVHAGKLIGEVAKLAGGGGGGRPDFAQASAKDPARVPDALAQVKSIVSSKLG